MDPVNPQPQTQTVDPPAAQPTLPSFEPIPLRKQPDTGLMIVGVTLLVMIIPITIGLAMLLFGIFVAALFAANYLGSAISMIVALIVISGGWKVSELIIKHMVNQR